MSNFLYLIPLSILLGISGLAVFLWSLRARQYDDLEGAAERILFDVDEPAADRLANKPRNSLYLGDVVSSERSDVKGRIEDGTET